MVDWKPAMRSQPLRLRYRQDCFRADSLPWALFGLFWMAAAAAWAVALYVRGQRPAWITIGAGARIGLVTGLLAAWLAFTVSGGVLFVERFVLHHSSQIDSEWKSRVEMSQQMTQQWAAELEPVRRSTGAIVCDAGSGVDAVAVGTRRYGGLQPRLQSDLPVVLCRGRRRTGRAPAGSRRAARSLTSFRGRSYALCEVRRLK